MAPTRRLLICLALLALAAGAAPLRAAEVSYPPGSPIGLVPPSGMVTSQSFFGYEDRDNQVAVMMVALPVEAYADLDKSVSTDALKRQGVALEAREAIELPTAKAFLVIGRQEVDKTKLRKWILVANFPTLTALVTVQVPDTARTAYPDTAIRAALATVASRGAVPVEEQLGLLPFKVADLGGFRVGGVIAGRAVMLSDAPASATSPLGDTLEPHIFVAVAPGAPAQTAEREAFARDVFATIPNIKDIHITTSEPLRISSQQGYQIIASARDAAGTSALTVVQWLRFGGGAYMQMVGISRAEAWKDAYPRFRAVRDGIEPR